MEAFPAFFPLSGRRIVIAGEGDGADAKARLLASSPAKVERVSGETAARPEAYAGARLVFVASPDAAFCAAAAEAARAAGAAVNVVDHPELCDFHTPAIVDRGQVIAAIGTGGAAPMLAALLRADLEAKIPAALGPLAALLGRRREEIRTAFPDLAERRAFLRGVLDGTVGRAAEAGDLEAADRALLAAIAVGASARGRVWLIAAPAARDLLTLRAAKALAEADVLVLGDGAADVSVLARRDASWRTLAASDAEGLAAEASQGRQVAVIAPAGELALLAVVLTDLGAPHEALAAAPPG
ncbi:MAG TPA: siroheme synthase [Caulobacteraceae bacterium]|nr:siroheme synthase [Caulobacteraceae bacterium]